MALNGGKFCPASRQLTERPAFRGYLTAEVHPSTVPRQFVQREEPWHRLYLTRTLSSYYKTVYYPIEQKDKLDFQLEGNYDHHGHFNASNAQVVQREVPHRCLNRFHYEPEPFKTNECQPYKCHIVYISTFPEKQSIHTAKLAIERTHLVQSNAGYSRQPKAGGIYMF